MNYNTRIAAYDLRACNIPLFVTDHFRYPLNRLHETVTEEIGRLEVGQDQQTKFHKKFYEIDPSFWDVYLRFAKRIAESVLECKPDEYVIQRRPTFRVHLPGNVATGGWHRDGDYNHPGEEMNVVLPLTDFIPPSADGHAGNGFFVEWPHENWEVEQRFKHFFHPVMCPGELLAFHGAKLLHGSVENRTGLTRCSLDFRICPKSALEEAAKRATVNQKIPFTVGPEGYYTEPPNVNAVK